MSAVGPKLTFSVVHRNVWFEKKSEKHLLAVSFSANDP
jgi:hypothetical protein